MTLWLLLGVGIVIIAILALWPRKKSAAPSQASVESEGSNTKGSASKRSAQTETEAHANDGAAAPSTSGLAPKRDRGDDDDEDALDDPTMVRFVPPAPAVPNIDAPAVPVLRVSDEGADEDDDDGHPSSGRVPTMQPPAMPIAYDDDAIVDEPTANSPLILVSAVGQTDRGRRRKRNEDSLLVLKDQALFVVADGMGGYNGGEVASKLAVDTIQQAYQQHQFQGAKHESLPRRASELARAIQMANDAIRAEAKKDPKLVGMGTTVVAARFALKKQRLYIGHVGDSRVYRLRNNQLSQMTADHTLEQLGVPGAISTHLSRAVGVWSTVQVDVIFGKPLANDVYMLCSDGLNKMISNEKIEEILRAEKNPTAAVERLVATANEAGGRDNVSVIVVRVVDPSSAIAAA
jgi:protein phosphatase